MRILGSVMFVLLLALFGFGFSLAYTVSLSRQLTEMQTQLANLQGELQAVRVQYAMLLEERNQLAAQAAGLSSENAALRARIETLESERQSLGGQIQSLQRRLALIAEADSLLGWLNSSFVGRLAALLVVPVMPLSFGAVYILRHRRITRPQAASTKSSAPFQAALTREEFHELGRLRKSRAAPPFPSACLNGSNDRVSG